MLQANRNMEEQKQNDQHIFQLKSRKKVKRNKMKNLNLAEQFEE